MMRCCCFLLLRDMTRAARGHLVLAARMLRSPDVIAEGGNALGAAVAELSTLNRDELRARATMLGVHKY